MKQPLLCSVRTPSEDAPLLNHSDYYNNNDGDDEDPLKDFSPLASTSSLVYATVDNGLVEIMLAQDVARVRVQLKETFHGIPLDMIDTQQQQQKQNKKKIDKTHPHYLLAGGMMMGIRESVGGVDGLREVDCGDVLYAQAPTLLRECRMNRRYVFPNGNKFKAYAPFVFARIRSYMGIDKNLFLHSVCGNFKYSEFSSNAKSGSFFFFSHDGRYLIKTLTMEECHFLVSILPTYYEYVVKNRDSFLTNFYGLYRLQTTNNARTIYFSIMRSVFTPRVPVHHTYDLKGSTLGRQAKPHESVKKDLDILDDGTKLELPQGIADSVIRQLGRDAALLAKLGIMDYSFLLGIHEKTKTEDHAEEEEPQDDDMNREEQTRDDSDAHQQQRGSSSDDLSMNDVILYHEDEYIDGDTPEWMVTCCLDDWSGVVSAAWTGSPRQTPLHEEYSSNSHLDVPFTYRADGGIEAGDKIYFAGIIDILQTYNTLKWGETVLKQAQGNSPQEISSVDPENYARRFIKFMAGLVASDQQQGETSVRLPDEEQSS